MEQRSAPLPSVRHFLAAASSVVIAILFSLSLGSHSTQAAVSFIQGASIIPGGGSNISLAFPSGVTAGNLIVAASTWGAASGYPTCTDNQGDVFATSSLLVHYDVANGQGIGICYALNAKGGPTTVTVAFPNPGYTGLAIHEYSGIAPTNALDAAAAGGGIGSTALNGDATPSLTTTAANDLIVGFIVDDSGGMATFTAGTGFTLRQQPPAANFNSMATEDMLQATAGSASATFTANKAESFMAVAAAFKTTGPPPPPDTTPPTVPQNLTATATSSSQINLAWTASTDPDNTASQVSYNVYRGGTRIATTTAGVTAYADTGLPASTTYAYAVSASDPAGNVSALSTSTSATTFAADLTPPIISAVSASAIAPTSATISWTTNKPSDSDVLYGLTLGYGSSTPLAPSLVTSHAQNLSGLTPSTTYNYQVLSKDASGNTASSANFTFTTTAAPPQSSPTKIESSINPLLPGTAITTYNYYLANPAAAGDTVFAVCQWGAGSGAARFADDKGNVWTVDKTVNDPANNQSASLARASNVAAGTFRVTATVPLSSYVSCGLVLANNIVAANPVDGTPAGQITSGTAILSGNVTTTAAGDFIVNAAICTNCAPNSLLRFAAGPGFTLVAAQSDSWMAIEYGNQAAAGAVNPSMTFDQPATAAISISAAYKTGAAGGAPGTGIHVTNVMSYNFNTQNPSGTALKINAPCPTTANLIVLDWQSNTRVLGGVTSAPSNLWVMPTAVTSSVISVGFAYAANAAVAPGTTLTLDVPGGLSPYDALTGAVYCVTGAATAPFDKAVGAMGDAAYASGPLPHAPDITPSLPNELIIAIINQDRESVTAVTPGYMHALDPLVYQYLDGDQDGGFMHYYSTSTAPVNVIWTFSPYETGTPTIGPWAAQATAFKQ